MQTEIQNEALKELQVMSEAHEALNNLINMHCHSPYSIAMCSFLLGCYLGLQHHDIERILQYPIDK